MALEKTEDNKLSELHGAQQDDQRHLARTGHPAEKLPQEKGSDVPNPVPANPKDKKTEDAIKDATPGNSLAQAVTTLNPKSRNQEPNLANEDKTRKKNEVNENGVNVTDEVARAAHDPNFAKHFQEESTDDEDNRAVISSTKLSKKDRVALEKDARNTNHAQDYIKASNDEKNNPVVQGDDHSDKKLARKKDETSAKYEERVGSIGVQPVQPNAEYSYLGKKL